ncbi:MAG: hypothetical protein ACPK85_09725 [Methanosarcina sp.]
MIKRRRLFILTGFVILILIGFITMPFLFIGPPQPLFSIHNNDINKHSVVVELFNSDNKSLFEQTYELSPEATIWQPKPTWMLLELSIPPGDSEEYKLKTILDNNFTDNYQIELQTWGMADIVLYEKDAEDHLFIRETAV